MTPLDLVLDVTTQGLPGVTDGRSLAEAGRWGTVTAIGGMPDGTAAGKAAVTIVTKLPDGSVVVGETTLALLRMAADGLTAKYPDKRF